jgi:hypothetical protein
MRYIKDNNRLSVKFVRESDNEIILTIPITPMEIHEYMKTDYVQSVMRNTFGQERLESIGDIIVVIDQRYTIIS